MASEKDFKSWRAIVEKLANITPHHKKKALEWLDEKNKIQNECAQAYHKYRLSKYMIPAFAEAMKKGDTSILEKTITKCKLDNIVGAGFKDRMFKLVNARAFTQKQLKLGGIHLHSGDVIKLVNSNGDVVPAAAKKIPIKNDKKNALIKAQFNEEEIEKMFELK